MKIDYVIMSSNFNPFYLDFWPVVSRIWKEDFGITPILCYIGEDSGKIHNPYGEIVGFKPVEGIPEYAQAVWSRFYQTQFYPEETVMISDIDMIPLSNYYFAGQIEHIDEDKYVHLNPCLETYGHLPACYHVAKGKLFRRVLELQSSWEKSMRSIWEMQLGKKIRLPHLRDEKIRWFFDEVYSHNKIFEYQDEQTFVLKKRPGGQNGRRIDRSRWMYSERHLLEDFYFDAHCPRPYLKNKTVIDCIANREPLPFFISAKWKFIIALKLARRVILRFINSVWYMK